jgi:hypothetical protein
VASLGVIGDRLVLRLSPLEKVAAVRGDIQVPLSQIEAVAVEERPWRSLRGIRAPGTGFPGVIAYGVRLATGGAPDFAALRGRGPAVRVELCAGARYGRLLVTVPDAALTAATVHAHLTRSDP